MTNETKVGILVVAALAALVWLSVRSGTFGFGVGSAPMRELSTEFRDVQGLNEGSKVKMAGVDVGEVQSVDLKPNGVAVLHYNVRESVALPADVSAQIATNGLIGEKYLALVPGPQGATGTGGLLSADATSIPAAASSDMGQIGTNFAKVSDDLQNMTATLKSVLGNPDNAKKLQEIIDGLSAFSNNLGSNSSSTLANINKVADNLAVITENLREGKGLLGQMMAPGQVSGTNAQLAGTLGNLNEAVADLKQVMAKINDGQGTIGKLVNDPATADKLNSALDTFSDVSNRIDQFKTELAFEGYTLTNEHGIGKGEFDLTLAPRPTRFYVLGATSDGFASKAKNGTLVNNPYYREDFGHTTKLTAQFGQVFQNAFMGNDVALRVGLKNSSGGVGVDTYGTMPYFGTPIKYSADVYDFSGNDTPGSHKPHIDLKARADLFGRMVYGLVGYDNVLNQQYGSPIVGVGMHIQDDDLKYILGKSL